MDGSQFPFHPPDRRYIWHNLALTMSQAASLTGVSERQIQHWMDKGYIQSGADGSRKINGSGLDAIMLIRQARSAGISLRHAVGMARAYLKAEASGAIESDMTDWALRDLQGKLSSVRTDIEALERALRDVSPSDSSAALPEPSGDRVSSQRP